MHLPGWNKCHTEADSCSGEAGDAVRDEVGFGGFEFASFVEGVLQQRQEHVTGWHQLHDDGEIEEGEVAFLNGGAEEAAADKQRRKRAEEDEADVGGSVLGV